jgi:hypothetical protein
VKVSIARLLAVSALYTLLAVPGQPVGAVEGTDHPAGGPDQPTATPGGPGPARSILVEVFLSPDHRDHVAAIKQELASASITRVRPQVYRLGHPPKNIAIGRDISADAARLSLRLAVEYNDGVEFLLPEYRFFHDHVAIGSSAFDEASQIPITPEDLAQLRDPSLSTEQFHTLYRSLTGEDKRLPTYLK